MFRSLLRVPRVGGLTSFGTRYLSSISHVRPMMQFGQQPSFIIPAILQQQQQQQPCIIAPAQPEIGNLVKDLQENIDEDTMHADSVKRKRKLKMKKHKLRKRRRLQRSLKKRLGK